MLQNSFGKFIRRKRLDKNLTLNKFAISADIDPAILSRIENDKQDIKMNIMFKVAKAFNLRPSELLAEYEAENDVG